MITLSARIDIINGTHGSLSGVSVNIPNAINSAPIGKILGVREVGSNPFIFGSSNLGGGSTFSSKTNYYIGSIQSDADGLFPTPYEIEVRGSGITAIAICFDDYNHQHPKTIDIDGTVYSVEHDLFVQTITSADSHKITISDWNTPKYPLRIQGIFTDYQAKLTARVGTSFERSIFDRGDLKLPTWGIYSNSGSLDFIDYDGTLKAFAEKNLLVSGQKVVFTLSNNTEKKSAEVGTFYTGKWNYNNNNRNVTVSVKDDLEEWQDIFFAAINYNPTNAVHQNGKWFYEKLRALTPEKYNMQSFSTLDEQTKKMLEITYFEYPLMNAGNLWSSWRKLCEACQLHIFKRNDGVTTCRYNGGN